MIALGFLACVLHAALQCYWLADRGPGTASVVSLAAAFLIWIQWGWNGLMSRSRDQHQWDVDAARAELRRLEREERALLDEVIRLLGRHPWTK